MAGASDFDAGIAAALDEVVRDLGALVVGGVRERDVEGLLFSFAEVDAVEGVVHVIGMQAIAGAAQGE